MLRILVDKSAIWLLSEFKSLGCVCVLASVGESTWKPRGSPAFKNWSIGLSQESESHRRSLSKVVRNALTSRQPGSRSEHITKPWPMCCVRLSESSIWLRFRAHAVYDTCSLSTRCVSVLPSWASPKAPSFSAAAARCPRSCAQRRRVLARASSASSARSSARSCAGSSASSRCAASGAVRCARNRARSNLASSLRGSSSSSERDGSVHRAAVAASARKLYIANQLKS